MWATLGNPGEAPANLAAATNSDGHLEVFFASAAGHVWHNWQSSPGGDWSGWTNMAAPEGSGLALVVSQNADARLEVFTVAVNGIVWHAWQLTPNGDWSTWQSMGNPPGATALAVGRNADGRLELVLARTGVDSSVWHASQTAPNAGWSDWSVLGDPLAAPAGLLALGQNADGHLEVFGASATSGIWHIWQTAPNGAWSGWSLLTPSEAATIDMALGQNIDGRLELFTISASNEILHAWQAAPNGGWSNWTPLPNADRNGLRMTTGRNADGRIETFLIGTANTTWHNWQTAPGAGWAGWQTLESQPASAVTPAATQNSDGRLELFVISPEGAVAHTWQLSANQWQWLGDDFATMPQLNPSLGANVLLTQHVDSARTGWSAFETTLNVDNAPNVHLLFTQAVDGTAYAQPLYVSNVTVPGQGVHNVVYVATENNTVYAFDADAAQGPLWTTALAPAGETTVSTEDIEGCTNIAPVIGVTSTPVIADGTGSVYAIAKTKRLADGTFHQYLCALDISTGAHRPHSPAEIWASCPGVSPVNDGRGTTAFQPHWQLNRPGLLLSNGVVYVAFGAHCDLHPGMYHGWTVGHDAITLAQVAVFCATPNVIQSDDPGVQRGGAGIWQAGIGLAADAGGSIYCTTGNGPFDADVGGRNYGDSVLKFGRDLRILDSFTPSDQGDLVLNDLDLGSGGVLVLPTQATGTPPGELLLVCGKDGDIFVLNRQGMGGYTGPAGNNSQAVQVLALQPGRAKETEPGVFGAGAYCRIGAADGTSEAQFVYFCGIDGPLTAFALADGQLSRATIATGAANQSAETYTGGTPVVTSDGTTSRTAIVWMIVRQNPLRLLAFDATDLTHILLDLEAGPWNNAGGGAFLEPCVVNGKVYVASDGQLRVFGT